MWFDIQLAVLQEAKNDGQRGGRFGGRDGRGGRGGRGFNRDSADNENSYGNNNGFNGSYRPSEDGEVKKASERRGRYGGPRGGYRGGRRGGYTNGDAANGERLKRVHERHSGTAMRLSVKVLDMEIRVLEPEEFVVEVEKNGDAEKPAGQEDGVDANKENPEEKVKEKEPEEKFGFEMCDAYALCM
ncbi:RGG repeats nuclear RNA binding protein A-like [Bidens hawaiensis]|uniref:RGG repeats nuclear RNA binding protein A-like n=1 Tax=Bidens hawaiensis TaxID=980011 RepID=UPI004048FDD5